MTCVSTLSLWGPSGCERPATNNVGCPPRSGLECVLSPCYPLFIQTFFFESQKWTPVQEPQSFGLSFRCLLLQLIHSFPGKMCQTQWRLECVGKGAVHNKQQQEIIQGFRKLISPWNSSISTDSLELGSVVTQYASSVWAQPCFWHPFPKKATCHI